MDKRLKSVVDFLISKDFIVSFTATMLGVLVAFWLNGIWHQHIRNDITRHRIHLLILETQYNGTIALDALNSYSAPNQDILYIKRADTTAARLAFEDDNVFVFLQPEKVSLLKSYIESIETLNHSLKIYEASLSWDHLKKERHKNEMLDNVRNNCGAAVAICIVLRESLDKYFDPQLYDHELVRNQEKRLKEIKGKALKGEVKTSKDK